MKIGSLCTGYGGLELALGDLGELQFIAEIDKDAVKVLDQRFPGVPNLGNIRRRSRAPGCDLLMAGFPCQPVSQAGIKHGVGDVRWLWNDIERILDGMERPPGVVFFENVRGLLSANNGRAMADVVSGLARLGYVGLYRVVGAREAGAPHKRERVFILAAHPEQVRWESWPGLCESEEAEGLTRIRRRRPGDDDSEATSNASSARLQGGRRHVEPTGQLDSSESDSIFGPYAPAIEQWERITQRRHPWPTFEVQSITGKAEATRISPMFLEWMMGLPEGWVTDFIRPDKKTYPDKTRCPRLSN